MGIKMIFCRYKPLPDNYYGFVYENCFTYEKCPVDPFFSDYCAACCGRNGKVKEVFEFMNSGRFRYGESPDGKGMDRKMLQPYDFFKSKYEFRGKHARMVDELCSIKEVENNYFRRVMDVYLMAAILGFRIDRKAAVDYSSEDTKNIFADVMLKEKDTLDFLMQTMAILENAKSMNSKESSVKESRGQPINGALEQAVINGNF